MKRVPLALAIGAIVALPSAMAQSTVQVYGKLYPYLLDERGSGATAADATVSTIGATPTGENAMMGERGMLSGNSRIGFRGTEDLGGGLSAIFQIEGVVGVDDGSGGSWNRDTFVGLDGGFGTIRLGNMDTVLKNYGDTIGILGVSSGTFLSDSGVFRKVGYGTSSSSSFHLRRTNSIVYETPEVAGFQGGFQYSSNEAKTDTRNPRLISVGVKYDAGPIYVALAHEIHWDFFGGSGNAPSAMRNSADDTVNSKDQATQVTVEYRLNKNHKFEFDVIRKQYKEDPSTAGRFRSYKNTAFLLATESRWTDQWRTAAHFALARKGDCVIVDQACDTEGLGGSKFAIGAAYYMSKRTYLCGAYSRLMNQKSARYTNAEFDANPNPGEDISQFGLGLAHSF